VHYVVCCDTGRRSSAGAYILSERGFRASVLKGGLTAYQDK
jgi:rhodanese-related sulfurtransferase